MSMATGRPQSPQSPRKPRPFRWTRAHLTRLPDDGNRYEVLNGELLVTPQAGPRHQWLGVELGATLMAYCNSHALGIVVGPGAVVFEKNELQPDVQVIPIARPIPVGTVWESLPLPILVVEILSPGSVRHDLHKKRSAYLGLGIPAYWAVDHEAKRVFVYEPGVDEPQLVTDTLHWQPRAGIPPLVIDLGALLAG